MLCLFPINLFKDGVPNSIVSYRVSQDTFEAHHSPILSLYKQPMA